MAPAVSGPPWNTSTRVAADHSASGLSRNNSLQAALHPNNATRSGGVPRITPKAPAFDRELVDSTVDRYRSRVLARHDGIGRVQLLGQDRVCVREEVQHLGAGQIPALAGSCERAVGHLGRSKVPLEADDFDRAFLQRRLHRAFVDRRGGRRGSRGQHENGSNSWRHHFAFGFNWCSRIELPSESKHTAMRHTGL
jgi:hypothetical protein